MEQYQVTGMSCAACSARVEKAVSAIDGVTSCSVSLLTNSMGVEGKASPEAIIEAVEKAGYHAKPQGNVGKTEEKSAEVLKDRETPLLKKRLWASIGFLLVLMYFSMGYSMWGFPLPSWFQGNPVAVGIIQMLLAGIVMVINQKFFVRGFRGLLHKAPNMDTLVALGSSASFLYSTYALLAMTRAQADGNLERVAHLSMEFYFESAAMILALITVGKMLESHSKGKTTDALKSLMNLAPQTAVVLREGEEKIISVDQVRKGERFVVRPGETIPVDGIIVKGESAVNEAALTGESIPVDKTEGDLVSAAALNQSGFLECEATRVGEDTTLSQIINMVSDAAATKAPIAKIADRVSGIFVPAVITIAIVTILGWLLAGEDFGFALARGISVLVISCPCALGLATPVAIMVGNGIGAKNGILFKTAVSLEETGKAQIVVLDKTGTITSGEPVVTDILPVEGKTETELLQTAASLEDKSEHPLAKAIRNKACDEQISIEEVTEFQAMPGNGLSGKLGQDLCYGGNLAFMGKKAAISKEFVDKGEQLAKEGKTPLYFGRNGEFQGIIAVADTIKPDSAKAIRELQNMGMKVYMLTGDHEKTAKAIGAQAGVDKVIAGVLPDRKEAVVKSLCEQGQVIMVGDGINDAPALTRADIGMAIGNGTDIAIDAADVVLMKGSLLDVAAAIRLSRQTLKNIHENLFWAFFYNSIGIPLAMGIWIPIFGWKLNPMFGAAAMSLSSFCVVTNALRLNLFSIYDAGKDKKTKKRKKKEKKMMEKTMKIEGMMCGHCEARVKKVLENLPEVEEAIVNHETDSAIVKLNAEISDDVLKKTVEEQDYKVIEIQ